MFSDLRGQVANYLDYMQAKTGLHRDQVTCSMTLDRALLDDLLNTNEGAEGIRIYLIKESADPNQQTGVSFLTVPVRRATDGQNSGLLVEMTSPETTQSQPATPKASVTETAAPTLTNEIRSLLAFKEDCPSGACPPGNQRKTNLTLLS